jgi:hypothetical protein
MLYLGKPQDRSGSFSRIEYLLEQRTSYAFVGRFLNIYRERRKLILSLVNYPEETVTLGTSPEALYLQVGVVDLFPIILSFL